MPKAPKAPKTIDTQRQGPWFIVNMTTRWSAKSILRGQKPTLVFQSLEEAFKNAHILAEKLPNNHWAIFECIGSSFQQDIQRKIKPRPDAKKAQAVLCEPATLGGT